MKVIASMSTRSPSVPWLNVAAGSAFEHEFEGYTVDRGPLPHDVGDEATVMVGGQLHRSIYRGADVDPVSPDVAGEPDVEKVFQRRPADGRPEGDRHVAHRRRRPPPPLHRPRSDGGHLLDDLLIGEVGPFTYL